MGEGGEDLAQGLRVFEERNPAALRRVRAIGVPPDVCGGLEGGEEMGRVHAVECDVLGAEGGDGALDRFDAGVVFGFTTEARDVERLDACACSEDVAD